MGQVVNTRALPMIRMLTPLGFVVALVGLAASFVSPFLPLFLSRDLHAGPALVSLYLFGMPLAAVGVSTVLGRVSDRPGARPRLLLGAAAAGAVGFGLLAIVREYWISLAIALTLIAVAGSLMPQAFAFSRILLDRSHPEWAATGTSALRSLLSLAWVAGPPLAAYLIGAVDFQGLYLVAAVMYLALVPVVLRFKATAQRPAIPSVDEAAAPGGLVAQPSRAHLIAINGAFILLQCAGTLGVMSLPLFVSVDLPGDVGDAGLILGLCAALEIPLMLLFGAFAVRRSVRHLVLVGAGFGVAYFVAMALTGAIWHAAVAQLLNACSIAAVAGLGMSYFQDLMPGQVGRASTMFINTYRLSAMLAGLIFGVGQVAGYRVSYVIGAGLSLAGLALLAVSRPSTVAAVEDVSTVDAAAAT